MVGTRSFPFGARPIFQGYVGSGECTTLYENLMKPEPLPQLPPWTPQTRNPTKKNPTSPTKKSKKIRPYFKGLFFPTMIPLSPKILISWGVPASGGFLGLGLRFGRLPFVPCSFFNPQGGSIPAAPRWPQGLDVVAVLFLPFLSPLFGGHGCFLGNTFQN